MMAAFNVVSANDKILGMIFGAAIGDRFGGEGAGQHYGQLLVMLQSTTECGMVSIMSLSHKLMAWKNGVAPGITAPFSDPFSACVVEHKIYAIDPIFAANDILRAAEAEVMGAAAPAPEEEVAPAAPDPAAWAATCTNAPLIRAAIAGIFTDYSDYSAAQCICTHIDPRVVGACALISTVVRSRIVGAYSAAPAAPLAEVIPDALMAITGPGKLTNEAHIADIVAHSSRVVCEDIAAAQLAVAPESYVFKAMAAGLYALHQIILRGELKVSCPADGFMDIMRRIAAAGGDVRGNCAMAGALMGCEIGYAALPADAVLADREGLERVAIDFLAAFSLVQKNETTMAAALASTGAPLRIDESVVDADE